MCVTRIGSMPAVQEIFDEHGPLTGLINNAAANFIAPTVNVSARAFQAVTSTVMNGSFHATHACGRRWIEAGIKGSVVSTLTTWIWSGSAFVTPSAMAKAAVHSMTMSLAVEWARYGIRLNAIAAGPIPTDYAWEMLNPTDKSSVGSDPGRHRPDAAVRDDRGAGQPQRLPPLGRLRLPDRRSDRDGWRPAPRWTRYVRGADRASPMRTGPRRGNGVEPQARLPRRSAASRERGTRDDAPSLTTPSPRSWRSGTRTARCPRSRISCGGPR